MKENPHFDMPAKHLEEVLFQRLTQNPKTDKPIHTRIASAAEHQLRADPFNPFIRRNMAEAFYYLGNRNRAYEELTRAVEIEPNYIPGYLRLAEWYEEAGEMEQSVKYKNQAIQLAIHFKDKPVTDPIDRLLLGRPYSPQQQ